MNLQKAQVTELFVRMDCNGCIQRIKRALHNLDGVYEIYIDVAHQKLTVVGTVEPEKIVKAIKKARKIATICTPAAASTKASSSETPPAEQASNSDAARAESTNQTPTEPTPPPKDAPLTEIPATDIKPSPESNEAATSSSKDVEEIHMVHRYPHNSSYKEHWNDTYPHSIIHSYSNYRPSSSISEQIYIRPAPQSAEFYRDDNYHNQPSGEGSQITSMFSEENPNSCTMM